MPVQSLTLNVPEPIYTRLRERALQANRTVEAELLEVLAAAVPVDSDLPADFAAAISPLQFLDDDSLWRAARGRLAPEVAVRLEDLHRKRQQEGLSEIEKRTLADLIQQYEKTMLIRAQAAATLKQRGQDVRNLLSDP